MINEVKEGMDILHAQTGCSDGAEAVLGLQPGSSISIAYHSLFGLHNDLMLLELDNKLLPEILHQRCVCIILWSSLLFTSSLH